MMIVLPLLPLSFIFPMIVTAIDLRFPFGTEKVRGVNIGGWLVLEPWITPSLFDNTGNPSIVDEWTFSQYQSQDEAGTALKNHWDTWITENDFAAIAAAGLNHVRIPIGYWAFDVSGGEPYQTGQYPYLLNAIDWCRTHGLKVIIDLHGVPGSQNGFDNSGRRGAALWATQSSNIARTNAIILKLSKEFSQHIYSDVVTSVQPVNEPASFKSQGILSAARQLYYDSYGNLRWPDPNQPQVTEGLLLLIHDAFMGLAYWTGFMTDRNTYQGVSMDTHSYSIFSSPELALNWGQHINEVCATGKSISDFTRSNLWVIVGEWTVATTDCAKYLNGRGTGSRYDGSFPGSYFIGNCGPKTGSASGFPEKYKTFMRKFFEAQVQAYEQGAGWVYWTWKAENADDWSYQVGLEGGWIPKNPSDKIYNNLCGYSGILPSQWDEAQNVLVAPDVN